MWLQQTGLAYSSCVQHVSSRSGIDCGISYQIYALKEDRTEQRGGRQLLFLELFQNETQSAAERGSFGFGRSCPTQKKKKRLKDSEKLCQNIFKERFLLTAKPFPHWDLLKYRYFLQRKEKCKARHQSRISSYFILIVFFLQQTPDGKEHRF